VSQFEQLKLFYNQLLNIAIQEENCVSLGDYDELADLLKRKNKIVEDAVIIKKMNTFSPEEKNELLDLEQKFTKKEEENIKKFTEIKNELGLKLRQTGKDLKVKSAYAKAKKEKQGSILDFSE
jgi:hypothetical protein